MRHDPRKKVCTFLKCPMCGKRTPAKYTGARALKEHKAMAGLKPPFRFGNVDLKSPDLGAVVVFAQSYGAALQGPRGFQTIGQILLAQAAVDDEWSHVADDIEAQCKAIMKEIQHARKQRS